MLSPGKPPFRPNTKMLNLLNRNFSLLLFLEHFGVDFHLGNQSVRQTCEAYNINETAFIAIGNLYNGILPGPEDLNSFDGIDDIIRFLHSSHLFYKEDKYPEIMNYLALLHENHDTGDVKLLEQFFKDYFQEVLDHLAYEEEVAFPYFHSLTEPESSVREAHYSAMEYREHHTDIETKLEDLKNLMLKHIRIEGDLTIKRKFLNSLFGLEFDLKTHSMVEELILLPLVEKMEKEAKNR
jgi:regulator of cell morphogenesis and NO signaling